MTTGAGRPARMPVLSSGVDSGRRSPGAGGREMVDTAGNLLLAFGANGLGSLGLGHTGSPLTSRLPMTLLPDGAEVVDVSAGWSHALALTADGRLLAWGDNSSGQLGDGSYDPQFTPMEVTIPGAGDIVAVAAGGSHSLVLTMDGEVYTWGANGFGQVGPGQSGTDTQPVPELVQIPWSSMGLPADTKITEIAGGAYSSLALTSTGKAIYWGTQTAMALPHYHVVALQSAAVSIALVGNAVVAATEDGKLYAGNWAGPDELSPPDQARVARVFAGPFSDGLFGITTDGRLLAQGDNSNGQLGIGNKNPTDDTVWVKVPEGVTVTKVAGGGHYALALTSTGRVLAWGTNLHGSMGVPLKDDHSYLPTWIDQPSGTTAVTLGAGVASSFAPLVSVPALAFGDNSHGQLGLGTGDTTVTVPRPVQVPTDLAAVMDTLNLVHVDNGYNHSLGVTTSGEVYAWGDNRHGQLGDGNPGTSSDVPVKVQMPHETVVLRVAAGQYHSVALTNDGRVFTWGGNNRGQLGLGKDAPGQISTPQQVSELPARVHEISTVNLHTLALSGTDVFAWGDNTYGQIGDSSKENVRAKPVKIRIHASRIAAGGTHSLAIDAYGTLYGWGRNYYGQLGTGDSGPDANKLVPTSPNLPVEYTDTKFHEIAGGLAHSMALSEDGVVFTCGANSNGQLGGAGETRAQYKPIDASGLPAGTTFGAIGAGHFHSLAATTPGKAYAWGKNSSGQLGTGPSQPTSARNPSPLPVHAPADTNVTILTGGKAHTVVI